MARADRDRGLLDPDQRRELLGLGLFGVGILLGLSLVPVSLLGGAAADLFPGGNLIGPVGGAFAQAAWEGFGVALLVLPLLPLAWGTVAVRKLPPEHGIRPTVLLVSLLLCLPPLLAVLARPLGAWPVAAGRYGRTVGDLLAGGMGWVGAALLLALLLAAALVVSTGWKPARAVLSSVRELGRATRVLAGIRPFRRRPPFPEPVLPDPPTPLEAHPGPGPAARQGGRRRKGTDGDTLDLFGAATGELPGDLPSPVLLRPPAARDEARNERTLDELGETLMEKLGTFRISGELAGRTTGPVVTQFEVAPAPGIKVSRIASLEADLALALRAQSVRIVAPIPGKGAVGVEVPNPEPRIVTFREVLESDAFRSSRAQLPMALGRDLTGRSYVADLERMPHLLIAGATGSGKSVCINTIITSLVFRYPPRLLRFLMVDPKMVELNVYNDLPHLRHPVVTDSEDAAGVLKWAVLEMERRYRLLSANGVRNLQAFNKRVEEGAEIRPEDEGGEEGAEPYEEGPLPYVVVVIDELADLMMTVQGEVEKPLTLLAQKARAIGIHLILATQRPSVNVITGLIKANFPSRIAFRVSSKTDSRTILDQNGADTLLGNGDMLLLPPGQNEPVRIQGAYLSTEETERLMRWYRERSGEPVPGEAAVEDDILAAVRSSEAAEEAGAGEEALEDRDRLFREAAELCIHHQGGSTSLLQRRLRIGYGRAARIVDQLHHAGVIGPPDGSKPREVLVDHAQLERICREG